MERLAHSSCLETMYRTSWSVNQSVCHCFAQGASHQIDLFLSSLLFSLVVILLYYRRMRTHYAEADNELHHLLIMESLGGNSNFIDRTLAQTMAFGYYWYVIIVYAWNEPAAYHLSELIEDHAFDTYSKFTTTYEERLKSLPVPEVARRYYELDNPFLFDLFCTVKNKDEAGTYSQRRPKLSSLYDVFINIRDDEREHWKTLCNLVQYDDMNAVDATEVQSTTPVPAALP